MKYLIPAAFGLLLLASCESKKEKSEELKSDSADVATALNNTTCPDGVYVKYAHAYNNYIIANQGYILESHIDFVKAVKRHESEEKVIGLYDIMIDETKMSIDSVGKLCAFNGNVTYKDAAIELFTFYQGVWEDYKPLLNIKDKKEKAKLLEKLKLRFKEKHSKREKELEDKFVAAHTSFANEYKLHTRLTHLHAKLDSLLHIK